MYKRLLIVVAVLLILLAPPSTSNAEPQQQQAAITFPSSGGTVGGSVEIRGTATHPQMDFYQLRYAAGAEPTSNSQWVDFAIVRGEQVQNGVLATWETGGLPNGTYTLALAVWGVNDPSNPYLYFVKNVTVDNTQVTPTPTAAPTTEPLPTAEAGPTPTPVPIQQPATPTPRPTPTPEPGETPTAPGDDEGGFTLDSAAIGSAFCSGGLIVAMLLLLWGLYVLGKSVFRWYLREQSRSQR